MKTLIVGIDVATVDAKLGLALAEYSGRRARLLDATVCDKKRTAAATVTEWARNARHRVLLAVDAPLGWPVAMGQILARHRAGQPLTISPNDLFRRETDRFIQRELRKTPLDVGADRIARTAHAALRLLRDVRRDLRLKIPLAWSAAFTGVAAIEVYPAATLKSRNVRSSGYKAPHQGAERAEVLRSLLKAISVGRSASLLHTGPDALDAVVCVLAAMDFIDGRSLAPRHSRLARREGWIWAAAPARFASAPRRGACTLSTYANKSRRLERFERSK